jgi:hypothetical protein
LFAFGIVSCVVLIKKHAKASSVWYCDSGHYIPQLAEAMVEFNKKDRIFNLRGVAVSHLT